MNFKLFLIQETIKPGTKVKIKDKKGNYVDGIVLAKTVAGYKIRRMSDKKVITVSSTFIENYEI